MKILLITFTYPPNKDGVSMAASEMTRGFRDKGFEVTVFTLPTLTPRTEDEINDAQIVEFEYEGTGFPRQISLLSTQRSYSDFLQDPRWDVVVFHSYEAALYRAIPLLRSMPCSKILVSHGYAALLWAKSPHFPYGAWSWTKRVFRSFKMVGWMRRFDRIIYLSEQADLKGFYDHLLAKVTNYPGRRVIPNGIDPSVRGNPASNFRELHHIPPSAFVFLCVANYSPRKDQGYAARAFRKAGIQGAVLVFIGSEFNEHSSRFIAADKPHQNGDIPGKIIWLEKQDRQATLDALAACDSFVLSANHEAQPIAMLEAMREGKPWIARKAGCISSMEGGMCIKSEAEMATAMSLLSGDKSLASRLGAEGLQAVETRYNIANYTQSYCTLIADLKAGA